MSRQVSEHHGPRKPAKTPSRTAAFREIARGIVAKDRYDRRAGFSVDTAGAIARALERAYTQGFADAQAPAFPPPMPPARDDAHGPLEWTLIPPRPRNAFWTICLFTLGRDPAVTPDGTGHLYPTALPNGRPGWRLVADRFREDTPFGHATLRPLVRLELLGPVHAPDPYLVVTARGQATAALPGARRALPRRPDRAGPVGIRRHDPPAAEISFDKHPLPGNGGWSYDFRHRTLGALGRILLLDLPGRGTHVS